MDLKSKTVVQAEKSDRYIESLAKHFGRKVPVSDNNGGYQVNFAMGCCTMFSDGHDMHFECTAATIEALEMVKNVIASHIVKYGELKQVEVMWQETKS